MRGTMSYIAYSAFEIGWALSVAVARAMAASSGSKRASSSRPSPAPWNSGSTNSIERYHSRSRTIADANATIGRSSSPSGTVATMNRSGSVAWRWTNSRVTGLTSGGISPWPSRTM